jgi:four helix bundle protein
MAGAKSFEELDAWKLSVDLRDRILALTESGPAARDVKFAVQIRDSCRSAPRNIAEGFGAFMPRDFARFVRIARKSLMETRNHLLDAHNQRYWPDTVSAELLLLCGRALGATTGLLRYLDRCKGEPRAGWDRLRASKR